MGGGKQKPSPRGPQSISKIAAALGVAESTLYRWRGMGAPLSAPYSLPKLLQWLRTDGPWRSAPESEDPLLVGNASPALERYREERAILVRLEREERQRQMLSRSAVHAAVIRAAGVLRNVGETLQRRFGPDALDLLEAGLNDVQREFDQLCIDDGADTQTGLAKA